MARFRADQEWFADALVGVEGIVGVLIGAAVSGPGVLGPKPEELLLVTHRITSFRSPSLKPKSLSSPSFRSANDSSVTFSSAQNRQIKLIINQFKNDYNKTFRVRTLFSELISMTFP